MPNIFRVWKGSDWLQDENEKGDKTLWDYALQERDKTEKAVKNRGEQFDTTENNTYGASWSRMSHNLLDLAGKQGGLFTNPRQRDTALVVNIIRSQEAKSSSPKGKSSLIMRYMDRDETPKPTVALDYIFGRKAKDHGTAKDVCHIWELGGGTAMTDLLDYTINPNIVRKLSCLLVLDLSKPGEIWKMQEILLTQFERPDSVYIHFEAVWSDCRHTKDELRQRIENAINIGAKKDPGLSKYLMEKTVQRIGASHPDTEMLQPFPVPLAIVGGRFDLYQEFNDEQKKMISKGLRFLANLYGASLMFYSTKSDGLNSKGRLIVGKLAFDASLGKSVSADYNKPILYPFGQDSMASIGAPPIAPENLLKVKSGTPYDLWKAAFAEFFPSDKQEKTDSVPNLALDPQFAEAAVDSMRAQKDEELERYRKMSERKAKTASSNMDSSGRLKKK